MDAHENLSMPGSAPPKGYSDGTLAAEGGRLLMLGGHVAFDERRKIQHADQLVPQVETALKNLLATLKSAGGAPEHLVRITIYTVDVGAWRENTKAIGRIWQSVLGPVYPAMTLLGVLDLYDPGAVVEIDGTAVIPR